MKAKIKVFVTVGTTPFRGLVDFFDMAGTDLDVRIQCAEKPYTKFAHSFEFTEDIQGEINRSDLVVSHAGAGTVYSLLENGTPCLVVPNRERQDPHQDEITRYISGQAFAATETDLSRWKNPADLARAALSYKRKPYTKKAFFQTERLLALVKTKEPKSISL